MEKKAEYLYHKNKTLKVIINVKIGFLETSGLLFFAIIFLFPGLLITISLLLLALRQKIFLSSMKDIPLLLFLAILCNFIGIMPLYQWLMYNFGKEIILLDNENKCLIYEKSVLGLRKTKVFNYCDITKITSKSTYFHRYNDYCYCSLIYQEKEFRFGMLDNFAQGTYLEKSLNDFVIKRFMNKRFSR